MVYDSYAQRENSCDSVVFGGIVKTIVELLNVNRMPAKWDIFCLRCWQQFFARLLDQTWDFRAVVLFVSSLLCQIRPTLFQLFCKMQHLLAVCSRHKMQITINHGICYDWTLCSSSTSRVTRMQSEASVGKEAAVRAFSLRTQVKNFFCESCNHFLLPGTLVPTA